jgi:hypothetical protein
MDPQVAARIACHDQKIQEQMECFKRTFDTDPQKVYEVMRQTTLFLKDQEAIANATKYGPAMMATSMAGIGMYLLYEHLARWEDEAKES